MRQRTLLAGLLAAFAVTTDVFAGDIASDVPVLLPMQPIAPTRTQLMAMQGAPSMTAPDTTGGVPLTVNGVPVTANGVPVVAGGPGTPAACPPSHRFLGSGRQFVSSWVDRFTQGVDMPVQCGCLAAEMTTMFGSCRAFFTPGLECTSCGIRGGTQYRPIYYGPGNSTCILTKQPAATIPTTLPGSQ